MHGRQRGDTEALRGEARKARTRKAVAPGPEGGAGHEQVRPLRLEEPEQPGERLLLVLAEVVVATGERGHDLDLPELGSEAPPRTDRAVEASRGRPGGLLPAEAREELVQVVNRPHHVAAVRAYWPVWLVAPR